MEKMLNYLYGTPARQGPEAKLVLDFISTALPTPPERLCQSIFVEPDLGSSIPDIVIIYWDPKIAKKWPQSRLTLGTIDYKLIHHLYCKGYETESNLARFFPKELSRILDRLYSTSIIVESVRGWELMPFKDIFAVKQIISYEAKMSASTRVFEQALLNTTFSSESYVVTKTETPGSQAFSFAEKMGVGLWVMNSIRYDPLIKAKEQALPQSYLSWLLNDLAWGYSLGGKDEYRS